jgi:imidazolonepropionase
MPAWDSLWINARLATMAADAEVPYGALPEAALAVHAGRIAWVGPQCDLPDSPERCAKVVQDAERRWMTPGLIDCHTHLIFAGDRATEFERRLQGETYAEIAATGGGIAATVRATRAAPIEQLVKDAESRIAQLAAEGVTTVEIKSGYGLDAETEMRCLRVARRLGEITPIQVVTSFLGAHSVPPEYAGNADGYIEFICAETLPAIAAAGLADAVDAYCETLAFSNGQVARVFQAARDHGLPVKLHADQFSDGGGAALAAEWGALSADHLEYASAPGIDALAKAGTTAVLLPGAYYSLRETQAPPVRDLRDAGVPMAIATDLNPGSSPTYSLLLMLNMACVLFGLTPEEALIGATRVGARALGLDDRGTLEVGSRADLVLWDIEHPRDLSCRVGGNPCRAVVIGGAHVHASALVQRK